MYRIGHLGDLHSMSDLSLLSGSVLPDASASEKNEKSAKNAKVLVDRVTIYDIVEERR
tara:strand:- start:112 stop:285 length:174 start_codon:yes stop_codon:yes gene_type:complete